MADVLIKGGEVVDGTGAGPVAADVRVRGGRHRRGRRPPDRRRRAGDRRDRAPTSLPGIIDTHTHLDGAMWWDPDLDPLPALWQHHR